MAMVAYTGIEAIAQLAGETKYPGVAIPRSIHLTVLLLLFMYFGIAVVGMSVISPQELGTTYFGKIRLRGSSQNFQVVIFWLLVLDSSPLIILFIASNAGMIGCSRLTFSMGGYYQVPGAFYKIHSKFRHLHMFLGRIHRARMHRSDYEPR